MNCFNLFLLILVPVFAAPQGYEYKIPASSKHLPCANTHNDELSSNLIYSQSEGRIVNHKASYDNNKNLVAAASGYSLQSQQSFEDNEKNILTQSLPPINTHPPSFVSSGPEHQFHSSVQNQRYIYNQAAASLSENHNFQSSEIINTEQNIHKPNLSVFPFQPINRPVTLGLENNLQGEIASHNNPEHVQLFGHFGNTVFSTSDFNTQQTFKNTFENTAVNQATTHNSIQHASNGGLDLNNNILSGQLGDVIRETFAKAPLDPAVKKHIYVHVPPEDLEEEKNQEIAAKVQYQSLPKKHYKIIFIKAPSYTTPNYNQLAAAVAPQVEEKTLIYVLVKKPEVPTLEKIQQLQQSSYKTSKPEVYFIKYKTRKEEESNQFTTSSQIPNELHTTNNIQADNNIGTIDIRSGGESNTISASSNVIGNNDIKHELYGVPLQ